MGTHVVGGEGLHVYCKHVRDHNTDCGDIDFVDSTDPDDSSLPFEKMCEKGEEFQDELLQEPMLRIYHYFLLRRCVSHFCVVI